MFSSNEIQARLREKPFRPLRIVASEGLTYDIVHPDLVLVGTRDVTIGYSAKHNPSVYDRLVRVALVHIVALEELPTTAAVAENGSAN